MRLGICQDLRHPPSWRDGWNATAGAALERAEEAERLGIDSVWCTEHHFFEDGYLSQPLTWCAAVAARTSRILIGTGILIAPLHKPIEIAEQAALVDQLSDGRLHLGMATGYVEREFNAYGAERSQRYQTTEAHVKEVRRLLDEGLVTPGPVQSHLPIWVGGFGPRGAKMAGRCGAGLLWLETSMLEPYERGLEEGGHDPSQAVMGGLTTMIVSNDPERAWATLEPHAQYQWQSYEQAANAGASEPVPVIVDPGAKVTRSSGPNMLPPAYDAVTPDEAVRRIEAWLGDLPASDIYFWDSIGGMPDELVREHMELLGREVGPRIRELGAVGRMPGEPEPAAT